MWLFTGVEDGVGAGFVDEADEGVEDPDGSGGFCCDVRNHVRHSQGGVYYRCRINEQLHSWL